MVDCAVFIGGVDTLNFIYSAVRGPAVTVDSATSIYVHCCPMFKDYFGPIGVFKDFMTFKYLIKFKFKWERKFCKVIQLS